MKKFLTSLVAAMLVLLTLSNALLPLTANAETGVTLEVGTEKELRDALNNELVTKVVLKNDLALNEYTNYVIKHDVTVDGANHKVTLNNSSFVSDLSGAANVVFSNINFTSNARAIFKTSVVNYSVTLDNITLNGGEAVSNTNGNTFIKGNNSFTTAGTNDVFNVKNLNFDGASTTTIKNTGNANAIQVYSFGNLQVSAGAKLSIDSMGIGMYLNGPQQSLIVGDAADLNIVSRYGSIKGVEASVSFGTGTKVKLNYQKAVMSSDSRIYAKQVTMTKSASVEAISSPISLYAVQISPVGKLTMDNVAYFDFRNENPTGLALYMEGNGGVLSTTNQNMAAWDKGSDILGTPKYVWKNLTSLTDLYGNVSSVSTTNVPAFKTQFENQKFERLSNDTITNDKPVINAADKTLKIGDAFDPMDGVTASDTEDGDLTSAIVVTANDVDTTKAGTYHVSYKVTDSDGNETTKTITVTVGTNDKPVITASDKTIKVGDTFDPKAGVTASDTEDGDLTSAIVVTANDVDTTKAGTYHVSYKVTDSDGNEATKTITVTVGTNDKPVITASDKTIKVGDTFDPKAGVTASDTEDGDLTSAIVVTANDVDTTKAGTYHVSYKVTDSDGNETTKTITVTVGTNDKPVITASDKTIKVGDTFDPKAGVTASDTEDGDLTSAIVVTANDVDTTKAGTYHVSYKVTDSDGNEATKTITVTVGTNDKPVITASDKTIKVGDTFDPKAGVTASDTEDGDLTSAIVVTSNNVDTTKAGTYQVSYKVTDSDGNEATKTITVTVEKVTQGTITADDYTIGGRGYVEGTYTGDVAKIKLIVNGVEKQTIGVTKTPYQYYAKDKILNATDQVYIVALDENGKELDRAKVNVNKPTAGTITANDFTIGSDSYVTGTYTGDVTKIKLIINGTEQQTIAVSASPYKYYAKDKILNATDDVYVVGLDNNGKELDRTKVNVKTPTVGTITGNDYQLGGDGYVRGTYTGDVAKIKLIVNGTEKQAISVSGSPYQYYAKSLITSVTDIVYVVALDNNGKELDRALVKVVQKTTSGTITANDFQKGTDNKVIGTYTGDIVKVGLSVNGTEYTRIPVSNGSFEYYANDKILATTDVVVITGYDAAGNPLDSKTVKVTTKASTTGEIQLSSYKYGTDSKIKGTYTGDIVKVRVTKGGQTYSTIPVSNNVIEYYAKNIVTSVTDIVMMEGLNSEGKVVSTKQLNIYTGDGTITADSYRIGTDQVTGTYTGDVKRVSIEVNGTVQSAIPVSGNKYEYYAKTLITSPTDVVYAIAYDATGRELNRVPVTILDKTPPTGTITMDNYKVGKDKQVIGTTTGDITRIALVVNGVEQSKIPVTNNAFAYYAANLITSANDKVSMIGYATDGTKVTEVDVTLTEVTGTITADSYKVGASYLTGTYTGDVTRISVEVNGTEYQTIPVTGNNIYQYF
ncbi:immunoglobulin-like domain-containing protein [Listeria fleischmannii]|uniref:immunoglobulin-like domain-containing protein n=3 Tax=Listeria fleischmannii TaxID=1069827 RepID=UPI000DFEB278|nr:immunoglobulin-like domain-containing protein [Listeria fleischmannii]STY34603.1 C protein alpha-antigen precursor [Listeria fleischmannii subsp. coloradonensis]